MVFYYIEEPCRDGFGWNNERKRGIKKKVNDLKGVLSVVTVKEALQLAPRSAVIVNSFSVEWTKRCVSLLLTAGMRPVQMTESDETSFVYFDCKREYGACFDALDRFAGELPVAFFGKDTISVRDSIKIDLFSRHYGKKAIFFDSPFSREPLDADKIGAAFASNDIIGIGLIEFFEKKGLNIPICCPISTSVGRLYKNRFLHFTIDNFTIGEQAVTLAAYLTKNRNVNSISAFVNVEDTLSSVSAPTYTVCEGDDYLLSDNVEKIYTVNGILAKSDETDLLIIRALSENKSVNKISEELFMGETTVKYRIMKLFGTLSLRQCRSTSRMVMEMLRKS